MAGIVLGSAGIVLMAIGAAVQIFAPSSLSTSTPSDRLSAPSKPKMESSILGKGRVDCSPSSATSLACTISSDGSGKVKLCWDGVVECGGTRHVAHACSSLMEPGSKESRTLRDFSPPINPTSNCEAIRVENVRAE